VRAREFLIEKQIGKIGQRRSQSTIGLHKFVDKDRADRTYELNRVMMAAACTDGVTPPDMDGESWAGRYDIAAPYTPIEADMLKLAYKAVGSEYNDLNHGDLKSKELDSTNKRSPVTGFRGYPR
jgi:hypothetical protein